MKYVSAFETQSNTPTTKNDNSLSIDPDSTLKPLFSPRKSSFHPKHENLIKLQPIDKQDKDTPNILAEHFLKLTSNTSENEGFSDSPNNLNLSEPEKPEKRRKTTTEKTSIYKNVLKKGFIIENMSPDNKFKVCTDALSNMTLSVASSDRSPSEDGGSIKKVEPMKVSKFQRYSKTSEPWELEPKIEGSMRKTFGNDLNESTRVFSLNKMDKKPGVRRVIFYRERLSKRRISHDIKLKPETRRKSTEDGAEKNMDFMKERHSNVLLDDFDHIKKFSKKEREMFQNHIQYLKYVRKITELKTISNLFAFIISSSRLIGRTEFLTKSNNLNHIIIFFFLSKTSIF